MRLGPGPTFRSAIKDSSADEGALCGKLDLDRCLKRHWKRYRKALKRSKKDFSEPATHACRIEARRFMAALELMLPFVSAKLVGRLEQQLKAHLDNSDQLRDTQVQLLTVKKLRPAEAGLRAFAAWLRERERRLKKKTRRKVKGARIGRIQKLLAVGRKELKKELKAHTAAEMAERLMDSAGEVFARTRKLYSRIKPDEPETIHRTRVSFKKFRYLIEAIAEIVPGLTCEYLDRLPAYQRQMGNIQDRRVLIDSFDQWVLKARPDVEAALQTRARLVDGEMELVQLYLQQADQLLEFWPPKGDTAKGT